LFALEEGQRNALSIAFWVWFAIGLVVVFRHFRRGGFPSLHDGSGDGLGIILFVLAVSAPFWPLVLVAGRRRRRKVAASRNAAPHLVEDFDRVVLQDRPTGLREAKALQALGGLVEPGERLVRMFGSRVWLSDQALYPDKYPAARIPLTAIERVSCEDTRVRGDRWCELRIAAGPLSTSVLWWPYGATTDPEYAACTAAAAEISTYLHRPRADHREPASRASRVVDTRRRGQSQPAAAPAASQGSGGASDVPSGWYADPSGRYELRWWDGNEWREQVASGGQQTIDPPVM
jgi:hypothetical protein